MTVSRYRLLGKNSTFKLAKLEGLVEAFKAPEIRLGSASREEIIGWVKPAGIADDETTDGDYWDLSDCQVENGFLLRMQIEKRKVPAPLWQMIYKKKLGEMEGTKQPRGARKKLKDEVKRDLLARALPTINHIDAYWKDKTGELWLMSTSKAVRKLFETLFHETFAKPLSLTMVPLGPPLIGLSGSEWQDSTAAGQTLDRLSLTNPVAFAEHGYS